MLIYFFIGCAIGALIYFLRSKRTQKKKNNLGIIPFLGISFAAGNYLFFREEMAFILVVKTLLSILSPVLHSLSF
ncbi:hypothetical protein AAD017_02310 [Proteus terrae]|uniref:hypothetical protein n=1 Tax=Proteus terrae TaxID=1574161 RepID=UPI00389D18F7